MASTFRRTRAQPPVGSAAGGLSGAANNANAAATPPLQLRGTRAWTAGTVLVSTGLRELDGILAGGSGGGAAGGGGQPLMTCLYLGQDRLGTAAGSCLLRYWCAEVSLYWY